MFFKVSHSFLWEFQTSSKAYADESAVLFAIERFQIVFNFRLFRPTDLATRICDIASRYSQEDFKLKQKYSKKISKQKKNEEICKQVRTEKTPCFDHVTRNKISHS